jgi:hypothetical protein
MSRAAGDHVELNQRTRSLWLSRGLLALTVTISASTATAQPKWEIDFHGGGTFAGNATGGRAQLPEPGTPFTTAAGTPSRRASSWYFGDGAKLLNEINATFLSFELPAAVGRMTSLDPVLNARLAERQNGGSFGVRLGRLINRRLRAEVSVDYSGGALEIGKDVAVAIESTRGSFVTAWASLIAAAGGLAAPNVTSVITVDNGNAHQIVVLGSASFNLTQPGRFTPYATLGGGLLDNFGDTPSVTVSGSYEFQVLRFVTYQFTERDSVTVRHTAPDTSFVGMFGAGFTYDVFQRSGVRVDVRAHLSPSRSTTTVSARPDVVSQSPFLIAVPNIFGSPTIQFSNNSDPRSLHRSTFTGPEIIDFETFTGSGLQRQLGVTAGWYWRF